MIERCFKCGKKIEIDRKVEAHEDWVKSLKSHETVFCTECGDEFIKTIKLIKEGKIQKRYSREFLSEMRNALKQNNDK
jgi:DNA-directed RNA polymerase subunit RPC12/RpoP